MSVRLYPSALPLLLNPTVGWEGVDVRAAALAQSYVYDPLHTMLDDIEASRVIATSDEIGNRTFEDGYALGGPARFAPFVDTRYVYHVVLYADVGGDPAYSPLLAYYGPEYVLGTPFRPQGQELFVYPFADAGGYFRLVDGILYGVMGATQFAGSLAIAELSGGLVLVLPAVSLGLRLSVRDRVCMPPDEDESCCGPTIRSIRCA